MIVSFHDKETQRLFTRTPSQKFPSSIQHTALRKLWMLDATTTFVDLRFPPGNHLEQLKGSRKGQYSIRINKQWRICFVWKDGNSHDVEITDYH